MRLRKKILLGAILCFVLINVIAFIHAYTFTHFTDANISRTKDPEDLSMTEKAATLFMGIDNPRPHNRSKPHQPYKEMMIDDTLSCWLVETPEAKGTVILFHGYAGEKSSLLSRSDEFIRMGYNTFLVDFTGSGGSKGDETTVGFKEAEQVKTCYDYISSSGEDKIYLFGTSMGAAAILKAMQDHNLMPAALILECPFGSLYNTVSARFNIIGVPAFPMAAFLSFWGGVQHGYWAFSHNPKEYAKSVSCPVLLLYGEQDERVTREETDNIYNNLKGKKFLKCYSKAGHNVFTEQNKPNWIKDVSDFIRETESNVHVTETIAVRSDQQYAG